MPAQKARPPAPVSTMTRTSSSLSASSKLSYRPFSTPVLSAFILDSLRIVIHAIRFDFSYVTSSNVFSATKNLSISRSMPCSAQ